MLETQVVTAPRGVVSTPRRAELSLTMSAATAPSIGLSAEPSSARPAPNRKSVDRLARSEGRLMMAAAACTMIFCAVLVIYLAAYARVTNLGLSQSHARVELRALSQQNQILRAKLASMQSPDDIVKHAALLGMTPGTRPVCYIPPGGGAMQAALTPVAAQAAWTPGVVAMPATANFDTADRSSRVASSGANSVNIASASLGH